MKGEEDPMKIFEIVKSKKLLPAKIDELVPLSFIGQAAVGFYRQKIKLMDQLKMTEAQRKATLADGQDAGEMLLDIEARIGELLPSPEEAQKLGSRRGADISAGRKTTPCVRPQGVDAQRAKHSRKIHNNPDIVEKVKKQARENEDIPTKTAVLSEIRYEKEKKRRKEAEKNRQEIKTIITIDQTKYLNALDRCISILPQKPPKKWNEKAIKEATTKAKIIIKRLEVFI